MIMQDRHLKIQEAAAPTEQKQKVAQWLTLSHKSQNHNEAILNTLGFYILYYLLLRGKINLRLRFLFWS